MSNVKEEYTWVHCNRCGHETKHDLLCKHKNEESINPFPFDHLTVEFVTTHSLLVCRGCEEVTLSKRDWCSEDDPTSQRDLTFYPPRVSRRKPAWMDRVELPGEYVGLLDEVYLALHADSRRLATMGARALIDLIIQRRVGDQGTFADGLKEMVDRGFLSSHNRALVEAAVDAGHASSHRGYRPSADDIATVVDIVENLIQNELLETPASVLKAATPKRPARSKQKKKQNP